MQVLRNKDCLLWLDRSSVSVIHGNSESNILY